MMLSLDSALQRFIDERIRSGAYATPEEVVCAAFASLKQQEDALAPGELEKLLAEGEESIRREGTVSADEVFGGIRKRSQTRRAAMRAETSKVG